MLHILSECKYSFTFTLVQHVISISDSQFLYCLEIIDLPMLYLGL